jgi:hypothetical protein
VSEYGNAVVAELPRLDQQAAEVCDDAGMRDEDRDGQANCADSGCASHPACAEDPTALTYDKDVDAAIPDDDDDGIASTIGATTAGAVGTVEVTVDISHTWRGDLTVKLTHAAPRARSSAARAARPTTCNGRSPSRASPASRWRATGR